MGSCPLVILQGSQAFPGLLYVLLTENVFDTVRHKVQYQVT